MLTSAWLYFFASAIFIISSAISAFDSIKVYTLNRYKESEDYSDSDVDIVMIDDILIFSSSILFLTASSILLRFSYVKDIENIFTRIKNNDIGNGFLPFISFAIFGVCVLLGCPIGEFIVGRLSLPVFIGIMVVGLFMLTFLGFWLRAFSVESLFANEGRGSSCIYSYCSCCSSAMASDIVVGGIVLSCFSIFLLSVGIVAIFVVKMTLQLALEIAAVAMFALASFFFTHYLHCAASIMSDEAQEPLGGLEGSKNYGSEGGILEAPPQQSEFKREAEPVEKVSISCKSCIVM